MIVTMINEHIRGHLYSRYYPTHASHRKVMTSTIPPRTLSSLAFLLAATL